MSAIRKESNINVRIAADELDLVKRGAEVCGKSLSSFVIEAATYSAQKALLDQRFIGVSAEVFESISDRLGQPGVANDELAKLLDAKVEWMD